MDVTVLMMSYKRRPNLVPIMEALGKQTYQPKEIIIFNNEGGVTLDIEGATVINSDRNFSSMARPAFALLARTSHVMCHDDDLKLGPKAIENFVYWMEKLPGSILGYEGRRLILQSAMPYRRARMEQAKSLLEPREIDVVFAKAMFCETKTYVYHWELLYRMINPNIQDEDICTSLANQGKGNKNYLIPLMPGAELTVLSDRGVALSGRPGYWGERDFVTNEALRATRRGRWAEARAEGLLLGDEHQALGAGF